MTFLKIIVSALVLSICYGILHDLVTAHFCVEYFTIGHPKVIKSESPVLLAFTWGIIATWWVGLPIGILIAVCNQFGRYPPLDYTLILRMILKLLLWMFGIAIIAGVVGYTLTELSVIKLSKNLALLIDKSLHSAFLADGWSHVSSYISGIIGTIVLCIRIILLRRTLTT